MRFLRPFATVWMLMLAGGLASPLPALAQDARLRDALWISVQQCWNTGALSSEALRVTVTIHVPMNADGTPESDRIRMLSHEGGSEAAAQQAYEAARRAVLRCGARGFDLPAERYDLWREVEMVFNPENMRIR